MSKKNLHPSLIFFFLRRNAQKMRENTKDLSKFSKKRFSEQLLESVLKNIFFFCKTFFFWSVCFFFVFQEFLFFLFLHFWGFYFSFFFLSFFWFIFVGVLKLLCFFALFITLAIFFLFVLMNFQKKNFCFCDLKKKKFRVPKKVFTSKKA